jgi:hypothetical protein
MADPDFQTDYRNARMRIVETAVAKLQQESHKAAATIKRGLDCHTQGGKFADEIRAAKVVLDNALRGVEVYQLANEVIALKKELEEVRESVGRQSAASRTGQAAAGGGSWVSRRVRCWRRSARTRRPSSIWRA